MKNKLAYVFLLLALTVFAAGTARANNNYWLEQANGGNPRAQYNLGRMYLWGMSDLGIQQNDQQAYKWFLKSAEQGYAPAQYAVGVALREGRGVQANAVNAGTWLKKAAAQGYKPDETLFSHGAVAGATDASGSTAIPPGELVSMISRLDAAAVTESLSNVSFFSGWWSWWLGAVGLGFVTVGFWYANRVTLGVSSSWDRIASWREDAKLAEADRLMRATPADDLAAALMAETLAEFGDDIPENLRNSLASDSSAAGGGSGRAERTRWTVHVTFLMAFVVGGFLGYVPTGDWQARMDMGPDFVKLFGNGPEALVVLLIGGFMVGFGTRLGGGCTSGHALSGCSRFQIGSLVATAVFFGTAIVVSILLDVFLL